MLPSHIPSARADGAGRALPAELVAASLLTSAEGAEVHLVGCDGKRIRLAADEATARTVIATLWRALDRPG